MTASEAQTANMATIVSNAPLEAMENIVKDMQNQFALMAKEMKDQFIALDNQFITFDREMQEHFNGMTAWCPVEDGLRSCFYHLYCLERNYFILCLLYIITHSKKWLQFV